jgi:reactive intermediate/imine deaminase
MSSKQPILTDKAPKPLPGIYSQAIVANGFVFCSGQVPMDPATSKLIDGDVAAHTHQCIKNLGAVLEASGSSLDKVVEVNVFLADMADFAAMNDVYKTYFGEVKPSRTQVNPFQCPVNITTQSLFPPSQFGQPVKVSAPKYPTPDSET